MIFPDPRGQVSARDLHLLSRCQVLQGKRIGLHFVLADDQDVLGSCLRRRFERLFEAEGVIS